ncbi:MAG: ribosomal L7Ae/L30e/S12e/Gadd45 family protein [archaeon]
MDIVKELPKIVQGGTTVFGSDETLRAIKQGNPKFIVAASNCPNLEKLRAYSESSGTELFEFKGDSKSLGALCKKPFPVSSLVVLKEETKSK